MSHSDLRLEFTDLAFDGVNGSTAAEVAIGVEAALVILDGSTVIMSEPGFEILLLAMELVPWLTARERGEFTSDLGSVREDIGAVRIAETTDGWVISSDVTGLRSTPRDLQAVEATVRTFLADVAQRLAAAGYATRLPAAT